MYLGEDPDAGTGRGIGGPTGERIEPRPSVLDLWRAARADLEAAGAEVVVVDFPVVSNYEADRAGAPSIMDRGIVPAEFFDAEIWELSMWSWHDFLAANGQPGLSSLAEVDGPRIFPQPEGALPDRYGDFDIDIAEYVTRARADGIIDPFGGPLSELIRAGIEGLEQTRRVDLEDWMSRARPRRRGLPRRGRRRARRCRREPGVRRARVAQRGVGRERQPRDPAPRHPDGDRADGHDGRHRDAGRA